MTDVASPLTKRNLLSVTQKVFDSLGYTAPVALISKVILQGTWNLKLIWDDKMLSSLRTLFELFKLWLRICQAHTPRWLSIIPENKNNSTPRFFFFFFSTQVNKFMQLVRSANGKQIRD